jgi:putative spermidine/putrescine transport system substrate-binding protein
VVFEEQNLPDGKSNKGRVQAYDGPIHIADAAQYLMAHKPELGIKEPYELNEDQYKARSTCCAQQRELVGRYWHDAYHPDRRLQERRRGRLGVVAVPGQPAQGDKQPIASTIPEEGVTGWADTTMMHVDAPNPNCAYMWMEHTLCVEPAERPYRSGSARTRRCRPPAPTDAACDQGRLHANGLDDFDKIRFWTTPVSPTAPARTAPACPITAGCPTTSA